MDGSERKSFVMYASYLEAAESLAPAAFKECILKLRDFALYGEEVHSVDPVVNAILTMAKPNLNAAAARYQRCIENGSKGKEHGSKGGRPRKGESREAYNERRHRPETPRKPLDDEVNEKENEKVEHDVEVELIRTPAATEPAGGSVNSIGSFLPFSVGSIFRADSPGSPSKEDINLVRNQHSNMSKDELADRYDQVIDKVALARANGERSKHEALLAMEAALICQHFDKLPTLDAAKKSVVQDINAAVQMIRDDLVRCVGEDESEKPF